MTSFAIGESISTTLGANLIKEEDSLFSIDLTNIRIFWGLSILSRTLGDEIVERVQNDPGDISFLHKINPNINAELVEMHISYIQIHARAGVLKDVLLIRDEFQDHLRSVFGTFQRQIWAKIIHPEFYGESPKLTPSRALVFPFHHASPNEKVDYQFILERVNNQKETGEFLFRLTIENFDRANIDLASIPHAVVDDLGSRNYIAGSTKISESTHSSVISACQKGEKKFIEENRRFSRIFEQIQGTQLGSLSEINFFWDKKFADDMMTLDPKATLPMFKKLFLLLEDKEIASIIKSGYTIRIQLARHMVFLDLSRLDRVLNYSFNQKRHSLDMAHYLERMPELESIAHSTEHGLNFQGVHIFLIHHITSEILALLEAFRKLSAESVQVAFVKYGGTIPPIYLDILLDLPTDDFFMCGLELKVGSDRKIYYSISPLYSDINELQELKNFMDKEELGFFPAMKLLSTHIFLKKAIQSYQKNEKVLLVEDGGYIAPFLNQFAMEEKTLGEILEIYKIPDSIDYIDRSIYLSDFLAKVLIGSIEHTRNGYDRLLSVRKQFEKLFLTAYSIAISNQKVKEESKEVAHSILKAMEDIFHGQGKIMSRRKFMVLGAAGNIGSFLCKYLRGGRLHDTNDHLIEVDLKNETSTWKYSRIDDVEKNQLLDTDVILGVIGESILEVPFWEEMILHGNHKNLYIASGSTKTVEFAHLIDWLNLFLTDKLTSIRGIPVEIESKRIIDPQSQMDQGGLIIFRGKQKLELGTGKLINQPWEKKLFLFSDLSPVNFLYYGAPTEIMDSIISQLLTASLGMTDQYKKQSLPEPDLYAVDHQIDQWGKKI
ncbi:MAG: hypothetical protein JJT78_09815 [Leptospira sp.]|nr:hypothetical protein [Leptospira sp.]